MSTKLKISVTKEILEKSKMCGENSFIKGFSCAVALAVQDIFPEAYVGHNIIKPFIESDFTIPVPDKMYLFIIKFDGTAPDKRVDLSEETFEIQVPDNILEQINIDEIRHLLINHPTLELVEQ